MLATMWLMLVGVSAASAQDGDETLPFGWFQRFFAAIEQEAARNGAYGSEEDLFIQSLLQSRTEDGAFVLGDPDAPITIVEFVDWACSHCQDYHPTIVAFLREEVTTGRAAYEFRIFPTAGGATTEIAAAAAECAEAQGAGNFWRASTLFYVLGETGNYASPVESLIERLNLDGEALADCMEESTRVATDQDVGREAEVLGTPAIRVRYDGGVLEMLRTGQNRLNETELTALVEAAQ